jgi:hypothetical protein
MGQAEDDSKVLQHAKWQNSAKFRIFYDVLVSAFMRASNG